MCKFFAELRISESQIVWEAPVSAALISTIIFRQYVIEYEILIL